VIIELIVNNGEENHVARLISALTQSTFCIMATFAPDRLYEVFYLMEDVFGIVLIFVVPGFCYLKQFKFVRPSGAFIALLLLIAGLPLAFGLVYSNVLNLIEIWPEAA
jgi:hypothetical protein